MKIALNLAAHSLAAHMLWPHYNGMWWFPVLWCKILSIFTSQQVVTITDFWEHKKKTVITFIMSSPPFHRCNAPPTERWSLNPTSSRLIWRDPRQQCHGGYYRKLERKHIKKSKINYHLSISITGNIKACEIYSHVCINICTHAN